MHETTLPGSDMDKQYWVCDYSAIWLIWYSTDIWKPLSCKSLSCIFIVRRIDDRPAIRISVKNKLNNYLLPNMVKLVQKACHCIPANICCCFLLCEWNGVFSRLSRGDRYSYFRCMKQLCPDLTWTINIEFANIARFGLFDIQQIYGNRYHANLSHVFLSYAGSTIAQGSVFR